MDYDDFMYVGLPVWKDRWARFALLCRPTCMKRQVGQICTCRPTCMKRQVGQICTSMQTGRDSLRCQSVSVMSPAYYSALIGHI